MHSRWNRELQRRLGPPALWHMVCFTGRFDVMFLQAGDDSTQTVAQKQAPTPDLTRRAHIARDRLRWAVRLQRKKLKRRKILTRQEQVLVKDLVAGKLHAAANDATRKSGYGRTNHRDGTFEDIARDGPGIVRTVLDGQEKCWQ